VAIKTNLLDPKFMKVVDVIIIGAGVAGLSAAKVLREAGKKIVILEARSRIGGRIFTKRQVRFPHAIELGAEFIHGLPEKTMDLLPKLNEVVYQVADINHQLKTQSLFCIEKVWEDVIEVFDAINRNKKDETFAEYLEKSRFHPEKKKMAKLFVEGFNAADSTIVSSHSVKPLAKELEDDGTKMFRFLNGYDCIVSGLASNNKCIHLNSIVNHVRWKKNLVEISTTAGKKWKAKKLIISVPLGVLKAKPDEKGYIQFEPPLLEKEKALEKFEMGSVVKVILIFNKDFWKKWQEREPKTNFVRFGPTNPFQVIWNFSPIQAPIITAWAGGPNAKELTEMTNKKVLQKALSSVALAYKMSSNFVKQTLVTHYYHNWAKDPFTRGAYSYPKVGGVIYQKQLAIPEKQTLYFAGESMNLDGQTGTVEAAILSGQEVAEKILRK
jgi:monoamine oxidase